MNMLEARYLYPGSIYWTTEYAPHPVWGLAACSSCRTGRNCWTSPYMYTYISINKTFMRLLSFLKWLGTWRVSDTEYAINLRRQLENPWNLQGICTNISGTLILLIITCAYVLYQVIPFLEDFRIVAQGETRSSWHLELNREPCQPSSHWCNTSLSGIWVAIHHMSV